MKAVLGIHSGHDAGVALVKDNNVMFAINEERLNRIKSFWGIPTLSIEKAIEYAKEHGIEIIEVAFSGLMQPTQADMMEDISSMSLKQKAYATIANSLLGRFLMSTKVGLKISLFYFKIFDNDRYRKNKELLQDYALDDIKVSYHDHHSCHAATAYYLSGWDDVIILTIDGSGDGYCSKTYTGKDGVLNIINKIPAFHSPAYYYSYVTKLLGFKPLRHEGKITGLAAYGSDEHSVKQLNSRISYDTSKKSFLNHGNIYNNEIKFLKELFKDTSKEDVSYAVQKNTENIVCEYCEDLLKEYTKPVKLCLAGGLFANVKLNQKIKELKNVEDIFIFPNMGDGGIAVGAALLADNYNNPTNPKVLSTIYLSKIDTEDVELEIKKYFPSKKKSINIEYDIASYLNRNKIVARFNGNMEFGPRSLGNRSILYSAKDSSVNDWLNKKLNRTEFMPFAPVLLEEYANKYLENYDKEKNKAAIYMTITYNVTDKCKIEAPAVVHIDGTARPQIVNENYNLSMAKILKEYYLLSGSPILVNTSFNMHEEPIVFTAYEAIKSFKQSGIDYLAINDYLISKDDVENINI